MSISTSAGATEGLVGQVMTGLDWRQRKRASKTKSSTIQMAAVPEVRCWAMPLPPHAGDQDPAVGKHHLLRSTGHSLLRRSPSLFPASSAQGAAGLRRHQKGVRNSAWREEEPTLSDSMFASVDVNDDLTLQNPQGFVPSSYALRCA